MGKEWEMRKVIVGMFALAVAASVVLAPGAKAADEAKAADPAAAALLSALMPGTGEWYNGGFKAPFPWAECLIGHACCLFQLSSVMDAVSGSAEDKLRVDFWSKPPSAK
jgi:hypothetical protein